MIGESAARRCYEKFNENLIGCCEDEWEKMTEDFKQRMSEAVLAGMSELLEAARPFAEYAKQQDKAWTQSDDSAFYGVKRAGAKQVTYGDWRRLASLYESLQQRKD